MEEYSLADVQRLLSSIGKQSFVDNYELFKSCADKKALAERLLQENPKAFSITGQMTRINCARRIFENNLQKDALEIVISSRVDSDVVAKATILLEKERNAN